MIKLNRLKHIMRVWLTERFYGNRKITVSRTNNDLSKDYEVRGLHYTFECTEHRYTLSSDKWYVPNRDFYLYRVIMFDGVETTQASYPLMSPYYVRSFKYWHHLAIRAHIREYIHK